MKRIIDGKTYNTETAEKICDTGNDEYATDFRYENSALYITKKALTLSRGMAARSAVFLWPRATDTVAALELSS